MVEIIPKANPKMPMWQEVLFYLSILAAVVAIGGYFGLNHFNKEVLQESADLSQQISDAKTPEESTLKSEIFEKAKKINDFSTVINNHQITSKLFPFLGKLCHPKVQFLSLNFSKTEKGYSVEITAQAESYKALHQQILILMGNKTIENLEISGISMAREGGISFNFSLVVPLEIFKFE